MEVISGAPIARRRGPVKLRLSWTSLAKLRRRRPAKECASMAEERLLMVEPYRHLIRQYLPSDRESIRQLVVSCADHRIFAPCLHGRHELVWDVLTRYYLDFEPTSCWVVDDPAEGVVGYLFGCLSTARRFRVMAGRIVPVVIFRAALTGAMFSCPVGRLASAGLRTWANGHELKSRAALEYPAHLHVGVHDDYRQRGFGKELVLRFVEQARNEGVPGIHVSIVEANLPARTFFRNVGFDVLGRYEAIFPGSRPPVRMLLLGRSMTSSTVSLTEQAKAPLAKGGG